MRKEEKNQYYKGPAGTSTTMKKLTFESTQKKSEKIVYFCHQIIGLQPTTALLTAFTL